MGKILLVAAAVLVLTASASAQGGHCGGCGGGRHQSALVPVEDRETLWKMGDGMASCHLDGSLAGLGLHLSGEEYSRDRLREMEQVMERAMERIEAVLSEAAPEGYSYVAGGCGGGCGEEWRGEGHGSQLMHGFHWEHGSEGEGWTVCHRYRERVALGLHLGRIELSDEAEEELQSILDDTSTRLEALAE